MLHSSQTKLSIVTNIIRVSSKKFCRYYFCGQKFLSSLLQQILWGFWLKCCYTTVLWRSWHANSSISRQQRPYSTTERLNEEEQVQVLIQKDWLATFSQKLTIKAAFFRTELEQLFMSLIGRPEDKNPRVETVWPPRIWSCRQLFPLKKFVYVWQDLQTQKKPLIPSENKTCRSLRKRFL